MQADGTGMPPRVGTQYETGLKGKFLDGRLNVSTALFYIRDTGRALSDPLHPGYFLPAGLSESKGFEAEISGALAAGWQVYGGYSYVYTEYLEAAAADKGGSMLPMLPRHNINLWTTYNFQDEALKNFTVGGGIKAVTDFYRKVSNVKYSGDGYIVANAMVGYKISDNVSLGLNVNNIFDEVYFQNVGPSQNFYGEPRSVMLRLDTKF
jgi:outer-membrane receptor for ferric coprogen and ferric-rhodotorulic acid